MSEDLGDSVLMSGTVVAGGGKKGPAWVSYQERTGRGEKMASGMEKIKASRSIQSHKKNSKAGLGLGGGREKENPPRPRSRQKGPGGRGTYRSRNVPVDKGFGRKVS